MSQDNTGWTRFFFDANQFSGFIESREEWENGPVAAYSALERMTPAAAEAWLLRDSKKADSDFPNYGLYREHTGETLAAFFSAHGMDPSYENTPKRGPMTCPPEVYGL